LNHHLGDDDDIELKHDDTLSAVENNNNDNAWNNKMARKFVVGLAFAATMSLGILSPTTAFAADTAVKDADIVDFSMPSYADASNAAVNSNLKGDKFLLGEASKNYQSSSSPTPIAVETKTVSDADIKAGKEAKKAAMKALRAQQQADAEIAVKAAAAAAAAAPPTAESAASTPATESSAAESSAAAAVATE